MLTDRKSWLQLNLSIPMNLRMILRWNVGFDRLNEAKIDLSGTRNCCSEGGVCVQEKQKTVDLNEPVLLFLQLDM